jgi:hypothetical protein
MGSTFDMTLHTKPRQETLESSLTRGGGCPAALEQPDEI